jgi:hypothetical protein
MNIAAVDPRAMSETRHPAEYRLLALAKTWSPFENTCALCYRKAVSVGGLCENHLEDVLPHSSDAKKMAEFKETADRSAKLKYESLELSTQQMEFYRLPVDCCLVCGDRCDQMVCTQHVHALLLMSRKKVGEMCATRASALEKIQLEKKRRAELRQSRRVKPRQLSAEEVIAFNAMLTPHK